MIGDGLLAPSLSGMIDHDSPNNFCADHWLTAFQDYAPNFRCGYATVRNDDAPAEKKHREENERLHFCRTSKMSHTCAWRGACVSTNRDKHTCWL